MKKKTPKTDKGSKMKRPDKVEEDIDFGGRRKTVDRRRLKAKKNTHDPERRSGKERRSGFDRRSVLNQKERVGKDRRKQRGKSCIKRYHK